MCTYWRNSPPEYLGLLPMHHTSHTSSLPRRTASGTFESRIHTASVKGVPSLTTAGISTGSEMAATSRSMSILACSNTSEDLVAKLARL